MGKKEGRKARILWCLRENKVYDRVFDRVLEKPVYTLCIYGSG